MKKLVVVMMALAISVASIAQNERAERKGNNGEHKAYGKQRQENFEKMNLSDAQKAQMKAANENFRNQMRSLKDDKTKSMEGQKERREALTKEHRASISSILTPAQRKQWQENKGNMKDRDHDNHGKHHDMKKGNGKGNKDHKKDWKNSK